MKSFLLNIFGILVLLSMNACSSLHRQAEQYYEAKAYDQAIQTYERILAEDPEDTDARVGLEQAQTKLIDTKLIEVRLSRLAGNFQNSLDILNELIQKQNQWKFYPKGPMLHTQREESREAFNFLNRKVQLASAQGRPLQADAQLIQYKAIFAGALLTPYQTLKKKVKKRGLQRCRTLSKQKASRTPYFNHFVYKYCQHWGKIVPQQISQSKRQKQNTLVSALELNANVKGLTPTLVGNVRKSLQKALEKSPWYDAQGKQKMRVELTGSYDYQHDKINENRIHEYTVSVPYVSHELVKKKKSVPYTTKEYQCNFVDGREHCGRVPITKYRSETYYENEPITRYRKEPRQQLYYGWRHHQKLSLFMDGAFYFSKHSKKLNLTEKTEEKSFEHNFSMPSIGLHPKKAELTKPLVWLKDQSHNLAAHFHERTASLWESLFCQPTRGTSLSATGNQVHQCLRLKVRNPPTFAEAWYQKYFGVSVPTANQLLGLEDL